MLVLPDQSQHLMGAGNVTEWGELHKAAPGERTPPFLKQMQGQEQRDPSPCCWELAVNQLTATQIADAYVRLQDVIGELQLKELCLSQWGKQQGYVQGWQGSCHLMGRDGKSERASH